MTRDEALQVDFQPELLRLGLELQPKLQRILRGRIVVEMLDIHARRLRGLGQPELLAEMGVAVDKADVVQAVLLAQRWHFRVRTAAHGIKAGLFGLLELVLRRPFLLRRRLSLEGP